VVVPVVLGLAALLLRRRLSTWCAKDRPRRCLAALIGMAPAARFIGAVVVVQGIGSQETLSQDLRRRLPLQRDRLIVDSATPASLTLNRWHPGTPGSFYPRRWHDFASLLVLTTGRPRRSRPTC